MFEFETSMSRPFAHELHMRARREQARVVNAFLSDAAAKFAAWAGILAGNAMMLARQLAAESRLRRDIHILQQLHDRELTDMGLGRGEIERVVRHGRRPHAASRSPYPWRHAGAHRPAGWHASARKRQPSRAMITATVAGPCGMGIACPGSDVTGARLCERRKCTIDRHFH